MKVLVVSDTHGRHGNLDLIMDKEEPFDMLIHLGDLEGDEDYLRFFVNCTLHMIGGNNDYFADVPREQEFMIKNKKVFIAHGHQYGVYRGLDGIKAEARRRGADIVMYGHTHVPYFEDKDGLVVLNPGSATYPRQSGREPSYMIISVDDNNNFKFEQKYL